MALQGTQKQVEWAEDIRARTLADLDQMIASFKARLSAEQSAEGAKFDAIRERIAGESDARWWIETAQQTAAFDLFRRVGQQMVARGEIAR